jgi:ABC-type nickel/cobalt efflux system permease component RcnA
MGDDQHQRNERDFTRILQVASALSLGTLAAFLYSIKSVTPTLKLELSLGSGLFFLVAAAGSWLFWRAVLGSGHTPPPADGSAAAPLTGRPRRFRFMALSALFVGAMLAAFAYELRNVSLDKRIEVMEGVAFAVLLLTVVSWLFWKVTRFLEQDHQRATGRNSERPRPE